MFLRRLVTTVKRIVAMYRLIMTAFVNILALRSEVQAISIGLTAIQRQTAAGPPYQYDEELMTGIKNSTKETYLRTLGEFYAFLSQGGYTVLTAQDLDASLVDWWVADTTRHVGALERVLASVERVLPQVKHRLPYARAHLARARANQPVNHTVPLMLPWAVTMALDIAYSGRPRVAGLLLLQSALGLRPSEVLNLIADDLVLGTDQDVPMVLLGRWTRGTKAGRPQYALGNITIFPWVAALMDRFKRTTPGKAKLSSVALVSDYSRIISQSSARVGYDPPATAHGPRSGWATLLRQRGVLFSEIQELGRWADPATLRIYIDVAGTLQRPCPDRVRVMADWTLANMSSRFPWWP